MATWVRGEGCGLGAFAGDVGGASFSAVFGWQTIETSVLGIDGVGRGAIPRCRRLIALDSRPLQRAIAASKCGHPSAGRDLAGARLLARYRSRDGCGRTRVGECASDSRWGR
jgi:hypothetical protein